MLTDYHLHLRPDEEDTPPERYFTAENVDRYLAAAEAAGIAELGVSEHVYRFAPGARPLAPPALGRAGPRRPRRLLRVRPRHAAAARDRVRLRPRRRGPHRARCSRRATSTTSSARSTSSASEAVDHEGWDVWEGSGDPDEVWRRYFEALAECARSRPLRHPRPPRPGQGLGRRPAAARARSAPLLRAGGRSDRRERHRGRGLDRRAAQAGWRDLPGARLRRDVRRGGRLLRALLRRPPARAGRLRLRPGRRVPRAISASGRSASSSGRQRRLEPLGAAAARIR